MKVLVIGGTRYFGKYTIEALLKAGHLVTIATRGNAADTFGDRVQRVKLDRTDAQSVKAAIGGRHFDVICDKIAYGSNDIRPVLDQVTCDRYIQMSTTSVYPHKRMQTPEEAYDPAKQKLCWCSRGDYDYGETKRQAEAALVQVYGETPSVMVRYPFVIGEDDYSGRMLFYVRHVMEGKAMYIDNLHEQLGFIRSDEAGDFLAFLAEQTFTGPINGSAHGTASVGEILDYVEKKTGKKAVLSPEGDPAPYNGETAYSIDTQKAEALGYTFSNLHDWLPGLLDTCIAQVRQEQEN